MMNNIPLQQQALLPNYMQQTAQSPYLQEDEGVGMATYLNVIRDNRWLILSIALAVSLLGIGYAFLASPVYQANMLIHVEEDSPNASKNILGEMSSMFETKTAASAEMELLHSRLVASRAVDNLRLYINVQPKYFPLIGSWIARHTKESFAPGLFGYGGYVWGKEKMEVRIFNVSDALLNKEFVVTIGSDGQYRLTQSDNDIDLNGKIGEMLEADTGAGRIQLSLGNLVAEPGAEFLLIRHSRLTTIENVQKAMTVEEMGAQASGVVGVTLKGSDPKAVNAILTEIGNEYMRQNLARKTEEAEKSLAFLDKQLPELKQQLEQSENQYNQFRNTHGTIDLNEEAKQTLAQFSAAKLKRSELRQKRTELLGMFMPDHPAVKGIDSQLKEINSEINDIAGQIKTLPMLEQNTLRLSRDVKVNTDLYTALLNTAQQLRLATAGKISKVRMVDLPMVPEKPIKPKRPLIISGAILIGLFLGLLSAFMKKSFFGKIDDPREIEKILGVPVYATIPHSKTQQALYKKINGVSPNIPLLANLAATDIAIESLRNFRTALQFSTQQAKNNVVLMTGATPGLGKSFVSVNLSAIIATGGKRILLIDADLRDGHLHQYFGLARKNGLSDILSGSARPAQTIHHGVMENMDFISTGSLPPNPSELLLRPCFAEMLQSLSANYDLILVDTAPILAVADSLIIGAEAGAIYIITRAGVTTTGEIKESLNRLRQSGLVAKGVLFNDLKTRVGGYDYDYEYGSYGQAAGGAGAISLIETSASQH
ncbi:MAG TPA: polysaccharide biosynthesis tyrosine autokinase [Burkholderiaceae bacterium]|nr:polysaccharide biosynthesis tyrosine autokinase [Burkholderiaceae bacterium]